jgi:hypothetical protein
MADTRRITAQLVKDSQTRWMRDQLEQSGRLPKLLFHF